ncbi:ribonucleoside-diphosphate reductase subunit alpha [Citromicrobium phage vB_CbaS-RXM]|nr:ribonucleoside-diphosphate reductase subunit alpha [Citromicrobium phage vB_CbaS-RXM]
MPVSPSEIVIDLARDALLSEQAIESLTDRYMIAGETSPQQAFARAAAAFADDAAHAQRLYDYVSLGWFMFATPLLSNGGTQRGLPISCFLNYVPDSREGILAHYEENGWLASMGGGIGGYWGDIRSVGTSTSHGSRTSGIIPFAKVADSQMLAFNQGGTRRGSYAGYIDINHPEIEEWLEIRKASGGDQNRKTLNLHHGVNLTDEFMIAVRDNLQFNLVDPHSGAIRKIVSARALFRKLVETRHQTGEPYFFFIDTANRALPKPLKDRGLRVRHSNLCTEITLPVSEDRTAVCCLSSVNLAKWHEWKNAPLFIEDLMRMLDNTLNDFIERAPEPLRRAVHSALQERSVGLGALGWHSFLQQEMVPWESDLARGLNLMIFEHIERLADAASEKLAEERGAAPDMKPLKKRFAHKTAIAPNASSSVFVGASASIEPINTNAYLHKTLSGSHPVKNRQLEKLLREIGQDTKEVWSSIIAAGGSVQHLDFLTDKQKAVFKTAREIDQSWVVRHAADRQKFIDQAQSVNLFYPAEVEAEEIVSHHFQAWEQGLKSLYYLRATSARKAENTNSKVERRVVTAPVEATTEECVACEG